MNALEPCLALACLTVFAASPAADADGAGSGPQQDATYAYVANQGAATVTVIDTETLEIVDVVDLTTLGFSANAKPHHIVVEPDGSHWYLSLIGENRVLKFDRGNELVGQAEFGAGRRMPRLRAGRRAILSSAWASCEHPPTSPIGSRLDYDAA